MAVQVSIVTSVPWLEPGKSQAQAYREALEQSLAAEQLGFDCVWYTEHHFGTHGINSSVLTFAGFVAGATRRIRVGTAVVVAPLYNPVRLAEDVAAVDLLSGSRLELGLGSGYRLDEFRGIGIAPAEARARFYEIIDLMLQAWRGEPFSYQGKFYRVPEGIAVRPTPLSQPHPPIWVAAVSASSMKWIAEQGFNLMAATTGASFEQVARMRRRYDEALEAAGRPRQAGQLYVHVPVHLSQRPMAELERTIGVAAASFSRAAPAGGTIYDGGAGPLTPGAKFDFADYAANHGLFGPPEACIERLLEFHQQARFTHLSCLFNLGRPHREVMADMESFAAHVMPALRKLG